MDERYEKSIPQTCRACRFYRPSDSNEPEQLGEGWCHFRTADPRYVAASWPGCPQGMTK